jgi:hypothetical protein
VSTTASTTPRCKTGTVTVSFGTVAASTGTVITCFGTGNVTTSTGSVTNSTNTFKLQFHLQRGDLFGNLKYD